METKSLLSYSQKSHPSTGSYVGTCHRFPAKFREEVPKLILVSSRNIAFVYEAIFARMRSKKPEVLGARRQSCKVCCVCYAVPGLEPAVLAEDGKCGRSVGRRVTRSQQL